MRLPENDTTLGVRWNEAQSGERLLDVCGEGTRGMLGDGEWIKKEYFKGFTKLSIRNFNGETCIEQA